MLNFLRPFRTMLVASAALTLHAHAAADKLWMTDYDKALEQAKAENKPVLINFTGSDWCGWCIRLRNEVFSQQQFKSYAKKNLVLLEVDFPRKKELPEEQQTANRKLAREYGIRGYPTIVVLNPDGSEAGQLGYMEGGPTPFISKLKKLVKPKA